MAAPFVSLPGVSVPALSTFTEAFGYWENRTRFVMNGTLVNAAATQQAFSDNTLQSPVIGLVPGDYVVVAKKDLSALPDGLLDQLEVFQGYLIHSQKTDKNQPLDQLAHDKNVPDITYATLKLSIRPLNSQAYTPTAKETATVQESEASKSKKPKKPK